jgi:hypothetical protein
VTPMTVLILGVFAGWVVYLLAVYLLDGQAHSGRRTGGAR